MFLLPSIALGLLIAVAIGGKPSRLQNVRFHHGWLVVAALAAQVALFSRVGEALPPAVARAAHVGTYVLLVLFALANRRVRSLWLLVLGMLLNATAIAANGGHMPLSDTAAAAAGVAEGANVDAGADRLWFLGDVFALPAGLPFANVFSVGDVLIGIGMIVLLVHGSLGASPRPVFQAARIRQPLRTPDFRRLGAGRLVSLVGDWMTTAALIGWMYDETHATLYVALLLLVRLAPPIVGGSLAAVIVDRVDRRRLLAGVELARCVVVAVALAAVVAGFLPAVFVAVGVSGALAALSGAAVPTLVPSLVGREEYAAANALLGVLENAAIAVGAFAGGVALAVVGVPGALLADAVTFVVAAVFFSRLEFAEPVRTAAVDAGEGAFAGLRYVLKERRLLALVLCFAAATVATGLANATLPRLLEEGLELGPSAYGFGFAALAVGLTLGQLVVGFSEIGSYGGRWIATALTLMAACFALLGLVEHAATALLVLAAIGLIDGTTDGVFDTVVQREAAPERYGAVFGLSSATLATTMLAAIALAPALNDAVAAGAVFVVGAAVLLCASAIAFASSVRRATETPAHVSPAGS